MTEIPDELPSVSVPPELAGLVAVLLGYGLDAFASRNGGLPEVPGLNGLRTQLVVAAAAARGTRRRTLIPQAGPTVKYLTSTEAAEVMGLSVRRVRHLAKTGVLRGRKHGRDWQIDSDSAHDRRTPWQRAA
ncbi:helix-turn-helix domain-containing protein [Streptomyces sp. RPT161]|uniref:helix-turn-helix domain-containing protein n=1 Tax=Streptomyces sp. RPT161 TaxID=3015993 RepID=UPI0022B8635E|nr:helix-turn-helix domain-containing protein [Streptomyces sp. RPT161]